MKNGMRFVDCDMHIIEPPDLFTEWLDPRFRERVITPIGADGNPKRGAWIIDGLAATGDQDLQQYRKPLRAPRKDGNEGGASVRQPLSNSRMAASGRLGFAIERDYSAEAQVMGMELEGVDIAVLFPTGGLSLLGRDGMDPHLLSFELTETAGVGYNPILDRWSLGSDLDVNYLAVATKA